MISKEGVGCSNIKVVVVQKQYTKKEWVGCSRIIVVLKLVVVQQKNIYPWFAKFHVRCQMGPTTGRK